MQRNTAVLEDIQKIDLEISAILEEKKTCLAGIESLSAEISVGNEAVKAASEELDRLKAEKKDIEERLRLNSEKISNDEKKLGSIKNEKELNALTKEISAANKNKKAAEQELAAFSARIAEKEGLLREKEAGVAGLVARLEGSTKDLETNEPLWSRVIGEKEQAREGLVPNVKPDVYRTYQNIRAKRGGRGLAQVSNETCQGCFIHIPPQVYIQLIKGVDEIISCPHCHRILYSERQGRTSPEAV